MPVPFVAHGMFKVWIKSIFFRALDATNNTSNPEKTKTACSCHKNDIDHSEYANMDSSWWFQPIWKNISQHGNLPQIGMNIKIFETTAQGLHRIVDWIETILYRWDLPYHYMRPLKSPKNAGILPKMFWTLLKTKHFDPENEDLFGTCIYLLSNIWLFLKVSWMDGIYVKKNRGEYLEI